MKEKAAATKKAEHFCGRFSLSLFSSKLSAKLYSFRGATEPHKNSAGKKWWENRMFEIILNGKRMKKMKSTSLNSIQCVDCNVFRFLFRFCDCVRASFLFSVSFCYFLCHEMRILSFFLSLIFFLLAEIVLPVVLVDVFWSNTFQPFKLTFHGKLKCV